MCILDVLSFLFSSTSSFIYCFAYISSSFYILGLRFTAEIGLYKGLALIGLIFTLSIKKNKN